MRLTDKYFSHKLIAVTTASSAIDALSRRVDLLLAQFAAVRSENSGLRNTLLQTQAERDELRQRLDTAAERLETLKQGLPGES